MSILTGCAAYQAAGQVQSGRQALLINKPEDALGYFQQVAQSNPNYIFQSGTYREGIWTYVGRSQYILGRLPEARQSLEKALSVYPDDYLDEDLPGVDSVAQRRRLSRFERVRQRPEGPL